MWNYTNSKHSKNHVNVVEFTVYKLSKSIISRCLKYFPQISLSPNLFFPTIWVLLSKIIQSSSSDSTIPVHYILTITTTKIINNNNNNNSHYSQITWSTHRQIPSDIATHTLLAFDNKYEKIIWQLGNDQNCFCYFKLLQRSTVTVIITHYYNYIKEWELCTCIYDMSQATIDYIVYYHYTLKLTHTHTHTIPMFTTKTNILSIYNNEI